MRTFSVRCVGCKRAFTLALDVLASNRPCQMCGGAIELTPPVMDEIRRFNETRLRMGHTMTFKVECPVCARPMEAEAGNEVKCKFCGLPLMAESPSKAPKILVEAAEEAARPISIECPSCGAGMKLASDARGAEAACGKCQAKFNPHQKPLEHLMVVPDPAVLNADLATGLAMDAVRRRWLFADAGFGEVNDAVQMLQMVTNEAGVKLASGGRGCPLPPVAAAELLQYSIYRNAAGNVESPTPMEALLRVPLPGAMMSAGIDAVGWGALSGVLSGATAPGPLRTGESVAWHIRVEVKLHASGSSWVVGLEDPHGQLRPPPTERQGDICARLGSTVLYAARKLVATRAIFGRWATPQLMECLAAKAVARRLREIDPSWAPHADALGMRFVAYPRAA